MTPPDNTPADSPGAPLASAQPDDAETTGLSLLPTWRAVYGLVLAVFVLWLALLIALSRAFS